MSTRKLCELHKGGANGPLVSVLVDEESRVTGVVRPDNCGSFVRVVDDTDVCTVVARVDIAIRRVTIRASDDVGTDLGVSMKHGLGYGAARGSYNGTIKHEARIQATPRRQMHGAKSTEVKVDQGSVRIQKSSGPQHSLGLGVAGMELCGGVLGV